MSLFSPRLAWAAALLLVVALALALSPDTREAIADRLGLPGVQLEPAPTTTLDVSGTLQLGRQVTLDEAQAWDGFAVAPPPATLGTPDAAYLLDLAGGAQVSYVYLPREGLPETAESGVALLVSQLQGRTNESFVRKLLAPGTTVEAVSVNGARGFWISGAPHVFVYQDPSGAIREESIRLAGNVLLWEREGVTLRIEAALPLDQVLAIAESIPLP